MTASEAASPSTRPDLGNLERIGARLGQGRFQSRLVRQVRLAAEAYDQSEGRFHLENLSWLNRALTIVLGLFLLNRRGRANSRDFRVEEVLWPLPGLPGPFDGFRILHLSDLHLDGFPDQGERLARLAASIPCHICVMTGDFRFLTHGPQDSCLESAKALARALRPEMGVYGILGNHDFLEFVPVLEKAGIRMLVNESVRLERQGAGLFLAGVDDPHFYATHDTARAMAGRRPEDPAVFLAHSPEIFAEAEAAGADLYLCGHTHGGQICLPGGRPIFTHAKSPRRMARGAWSHGATRGYTSRGAGASGVFARFYCPPEITVHTLVEGDG